MCPHGFSKDRHTHPKKPVQVPGKLQNDYHGFMTLGEPPLRKVALGGHQIPPIIMQCYREGPNFYFSVPKVQNDCSFL